MAEAINIVVTSTDKTAAGFKSVSKSIASIGNSARGTLTKGLKIAGAAFAGLSLAGAAGVAGLGAAITKMTLDAAQVEGVASTFEQLAASINAEAEPAMQAMREATRGMVADADLMQAGNKFMAMGLVDTQEEMANLSEIATQLGSAMGEGPTESMENFALMLANQSIPRLDSFGISSGAVRERINELMEADKSLTRETAFMTAVMEQAEVTMGKVGEQGATSAASIARIQASVENVSLGIGTKFIPVLQEVLKPIADLAEKIGPKLIDWAGLLASWMGDWLPGAIEKLMGVLGPVIDLFIRLSSAFAMGTKIDGLIGGFQSLVGTGTALLGINQKVAETFQKVTTAISTFFESVKSGIVPAFALRNALMEVIPFELADAIGRTVWNIQQFVKTVIDSITSFVSWKDVLIALGIGIASIVLPAIASLVISIGALVAPILLVIGAVALLRAAWESNFLGIQDVVANLVQQVGPFIESVVEWFQNAIPVALEAAQGAFQVLGNLWQTAIQPALAELGAAFAELFTALKSAWQEIAPIFAELGKAIGDAFGLGGSEAIKFADVMKVAVQAIIIPIKVLTAVVTVAAKVIAKAAELMGKVWSKHGKTVVKILGFILKGFQKTFDMIFKVVDKVLKAIGKIWHKWFGNSELLDSAYRFGRDLVRAFVSFLAGVIDEIENFAQEALRFFERLFKDVITAITQFAKDAARLFTSLLDDIIKIVDTGLNAILRLFDTIMNAILKIVDTVMNAILRIFDTIMSAIEKIIETSLSAIQAIFDTVMNAIEKIVDTVMNAIRDIFDTIMDAIKNIVDSKMNSIKDIFDTVMSAIESIVATVMEAIKSIFETVMSAIEGVVNTSLNAIRDIFDTIMSAIEGIVDTALQAIRDIFDAVLSAIEGLVGQRLQAIRDLFDTIMSGIETIVDNALNAVRNLFETILSGIETFVSNALNAIRAVFETVMGALEGIVGTALDAVRTVFETVLGAIQTLVDTVFPAIQTTINDVMLAINIVVTDVWSLIKATWASAMTIINNLTQTLVDTVQALITKLGEIPSGIWDTISSAWQTGLSAINSAIDAVVGVINSLIDAVKTAIDWVRDLLDLIGLIPGSIGIGTAGAGIAMPQFDPGMSLATSLPGGNGNMTANTVNMGGVTFSPTINNNMDWEEFVFGVQRALQDLGAT